MVVVLTYVLNMQHWFQEEEKGPMRSLLVREAIFIATHFENHYA